MNRSLSRYAFLALVAALLPGAALKPATPGPLFPDSPDAYSQIEERACPSRDPVAGAALLACFGGLKGNSAGKTCWMGVTYRNGQEVNAFPVCTFSCLNDQLKPDHPCTDDCFVAFKGKVAWRSVGGLEPAQQAALRKLYDQLIAIVGAEDSPNRYKTLGGDQRRTELKQQIVTIILQEMIPYNAYCTAKKGDAIPPERFVYEKQYTAPPSRGVQPKGESFVDLATVAERHELQIFESAFYEKKDSMLRTQNPDVLAAEFLHEMIHWTQENYGYGQGRYGFSDPMHIAETMLNELMAYDKCSIHSFYRRALADTQRSQLIDPGLQGSIRRFNEAWNDISRDQQKEIAKWAWSLKDGWMRSMMTFYPAENGGVWGRLCAANQGTGSCGMVAR